MSKQIVRFVSRNKHKAEKVRAILEPYNIEVIAIPFHVEELQSQDMTQVAKDKVLKAFQHNGRPLFVEQTGIKFPNLGGFHIGSYYNLWQIAGAERISELLGKSQDPRVSLMSIIAYVDGRRIRYFESQIEGKISGSPRGNSEYPWDSVFIPDGEEQSIAERGEGHVGRLLRTGALEKFAKFLVGNKEERL